MNYILFLESGSDDGLVCSIQLFYCMVACSDEMHLK